MTSRHVNSSWIAKVAYLPATTMDADGSTIKLPGFLVIRSQTGEVYTWMAPSWVVGLLMARQATGRSVGALFNRLRPQLKKVEGVREDVAMMERLREMMS